MNTDTGEIKALNELTPEELKSKKWIQIPKEHEEHLIGLNRKQRREYMRQHGLFKRERLA